MDDALILDFIRAHASTGRRLFSVCTGALICGAAGILRGRRATTHRTAFHLLPCFGAVPVNDRVVIDGNLVTAAGVTAGIDGALTVAGLLCGDEIARQIQLALEYAPAPPFQSGTPSTAPPAVLAAATEQARAITRQRAETARRIAARLGIAL